MCKVFNPKQSKAFRQALRSNMPEPERRLWYRLRNKQLGVKFRRQHGIGRYIVDFYCPEKKLAIEIDGNSHFSTLAIQNDKIREEYINREGITLIRFTNKQVMNELNNIIGLIITFINK